MSAFDLAAEKKALLENLRHLKSLSVEEYTFHKKCDELEDEIESKRFNCHAARDSVWFPQNIHDEALTVAHIQNLKPKVFICDDAELKEYWMKFRLFVSSGVFNHTPGQSIKFLVVDTNEGEFRPCRAPLTAFRQPLMWPVLGLGLVSSDFPSIGSREEFIGWTRQQRHGDKGEHNAKSRHVANGATIVATQPFGYNFLGGKLIAALITSEIIRNEWQLRTGDVLAGMTTTSLFGFPSMYDRIPHWKRLELTKGSVPIEPDIIFYRKWKDYIRETFSANYKNIHKRIEGRSGPATNAKGKTLDLIYEAADIPIKNFKTGFERGVYFSEFYENTKEFLCGKISEDELKLKPLFQNDVNAIMEWWRPAAIKRYLKKKAENSLKPYPLFYNHLGYMDYESAKEMFFNEVGR